MLVKLTTHTTQKVQSQEKFNLSQKKKGKKGEKNRSKPKQYLRNRRDKVCVLVHIHRMIEDPCTQNLYLMNLWTTNDGICIIK